MLEWTPPNAQYPPPKPGEPPLHRAARVGDHDKIRRLVAEGHDINAVFDLELDPDCRSRDATPLMVAAGSGDGASVDTVSLLLELGADPKPVIDASSAATFAVEGLGWNYRPGGDAARLKALLQAGSPLPVSAERQGDLLCDAAFSGDSTRLAILLEQGFDPNGYWNEQEARERFSRPRCSSSSRESTFNEVLETLPKTFQEEFKARQVQNEKEQFESLVSAPFDSDIPLFRAAESGNADCVRLLLEAGANPHALDNSKNTAMFVASSVPVIRVLQQAGLSLDATNEHEWTPLCHAFSGGLHSLDRVRAIIEAGADVNAKHDHGFTIFMSAIGMARNTELLRMLVEAGADPHAVSELGYNAFHAGLDANYGPQAESRLLEEFRYLKSLGVNIEHRTNRGLTPLCYAIQRGSSSEVRALCQAGADPNAPCPFKRCGQDACETVEMPPLFHAVLGFGTHEDEKFATLLNAGANPLVQDVQGYTPLHRIVAKLCYESSDHEETWKSFFRGLYATKLDFQPPPSSRDEFIERALPIVRSFVEQFASHIPIVKGPFDQQRRDARVNAICHLWVYQSWLRYQSAASRKE